MLGDTRKAENESYFRELNERLKHRPGQLRPGGRLEIVCECSREECTVRLVVPVAQYEQVRANPRAFLVAPGHGEPGVERVLAADGSYEIVEKQGEAGLVAVVENPRNGQ